MHSHQTTAQSVRHDVTRFSDQDLYLFNEGSHLHLQDKLGSHLMQVDGVEGTYFAVWAPNAETVSVMGDFNGWNRESHPLAFHADSHIWEGFIPNVGKGTVYKYFIASRHNNYAVDKYDPFAIYSEISPQTASIVWDLDYAWQDAAWMENREHQAKMNEPVSIYEMHLGSWRRGPEEGNRFLTYRELAEQLPEYLKRMEFTHVEFLPVMEHPFYGSWGYQCSGFFAPTSRFGTPQDFMYLIDTLHQHGIGVIFDWVPSHFPTDEHGLTYFDGTHLFEHADPRQGYHPDWGSYIFNYNRNEVRSFLYSSALFWLQKYHGDSLRVDAVASMLYLDYSRKEGEWIPNQYGGNENLAAIDFLRRLNTEVYSHAPGIQTIAEESTAWPMVSRPTYLGGLGFGYKWDMGWMHDTLSYMSQEPIHRKYHHNKITFRLLYAFKENYVLPLSHDEVVHGKGSLIGKMPGDEWQKFANLRMLYGYMYGQPGKKLLFMGAELAQFKEWNHDTSLDWHLLAYPMHLGIQRWLRDLNRAYKNEPALHKMDANPQGFRWIDCNDADQSVLSFMRHDSASDESIIIILNATPVPRHNYRIGVPKRGYWEEFLNSDAKEFGGSGQGNFGGVNSTPIGYHGFLQSINITVPPLGIVFFRKK
ncbi:1,4-alpha-glucan branching protein GlgB [bacterium]|nr:1,4-alpha-glucan branching protein GlgB [bacterium]